MQPYQHLRVRHSLIAADSLIDVIRDAYDLEPPITCRLLSNNANDHYLVTTSTAIAILRSHKRNKQLSQP
jgi:hypothetical protein